MFETERFKKQLTDAVIAEALNHKLTQYQPSIIDYLHGLAYENEKDLMERELRKAVTERRGVREAIDSARMLISEASGYAIRDGRDLLKLSDVQTAYRAKFCQFWPFCK